MTRKLSETTVLRICRHLTCQLGHAIGRTYIVKGKFAFHGLLKIWVHILNISKDGVKNQIKVERTHAFNHFSSVVYSFVSHTLLLEPYQIDRLRFSISKDS